MGNTTFLLTLLIQILFAIFVLGLVGGTIVWVKDYLFTAEDKAKLRQTFIVKKQPAKVEVCNICGKEQSHEWQRCPYCGKETEIVTENI